MENKTSKIQHLLNAQKRKHDEYFTMFSDIEAECSHYVKHFEGKTVYCNADDYRVSNFVKYFHDNFQTLKLRHLYASCKPLDKNLPALFYSYDGQKETFTEKENAGGDFRSASCLAVLGKADIVVTNPPFSLLRDFVALLIAHKKDFIVIGSLICCGYKGIFEYFQQNTLRIGHTCPKWYFVPDYVQDYTKRINGSPAKCISSLWLTTFPVNRVEKKKPVTKLLKFDDYDAINVDRLEDLPYKGNDTNTYGVPITFLVKYNQDSPWKITGKIRPKVDGKRVFTRILIQKKQLFPKHN